MLLSRILAALGLLLLLAAVAFTADRPATDASGALIDVLRAQKQQPIDRRAEFAAVYNVVIDPTHNDFVGTQGVLTHDVTLPKPTNRTVPGLPEN